MRHIYIRGIIGLIWLVAAIVCGVSGNFPLRICGMEKREGWKRREVKWEKRS